MQPSPDSRELLEQAKQGLTHLFNAYEADIRDKASIILKLNKEGYLTARVDLKYTQIELDQYRQVKTIPEQIIFSRKNNLYIILEQLAFKFTSRVAPSFEHGYIPFEITSTVKDENLNELIFSCSQVLENLLNSKQLFLSTYKEILKNSFWDA